MIIKVKDWEPEESDNIVNTIGTKIINIPITNMYEMHKLPTTLNHFSIKRKKVYQNISSDICLHFNYFLKYFDTRGILLPSYSKIKLLVDIAADRLAEYPVECFVEDLMSYVVKPIKDDIRRMIEFNFEEADGESSFKGDEGLKFTNDHSKVFMESAMIMKIIIPVTMHYIERNRLEVESILHAFSSIMNEYSDTLNITSKIYNTVMTRVSNNTYRNRKVWELYEIQGVSSDTYVDELSNDIIIGSIPKLNFSGSVIGFIHSVIRGQMNNKNIGSTLFDGRKVNPNSYANGENLSELDKIEINMTMEDESKLTIQNLSVEMLINKLEDQYGVTSVDEFMFYMENSTTELFQQEIVLNLLAKHIGTNRLSLNKITYMKLMILMKKYLQSIGFLYLPQIISAQASKSSRRNLSKKIEEKIEQNDKYNYIMDKYLHNEKVKEKIITVNLGLLTANINKFKVVDFDNIDKLNMKLPPLKSILIDEYLKYIMIV